jgi:hypothetical protein
LQPATESAAMNGASSFRRPNIKAPSHARQGDCLIASLSWQRTDGANRYNHPHNLPALGFCG